MGTAARTEAATDLPVGLDPAVDPDPALLARYLEENIDGLAGPLQFRRFTGGHANHTYLVGARDREFVLKREPAGRKAKSAHDMRREYHILSLLAPVYVYAPRAVLLCEDPGVFGGVFCVMERIRGEIVRSAAAAARVGTETMALRFNALIDALAELHQVDVDDAGLGSFGKPEGYRERQVKGWCRRFREAATITPDVAEDVMSWLERRMPKEAAGRAVVHNDFKLDNLVWDTQVPHGLAGVLDWEMSTVGDPLMDLACTLSFWIEESDPAQLRSLRAMPTDQPGMPTRREALLRYRQRTGTAVAQFDYFHCFGLFRRAVIEQQKFHRFVTQQTRDPRYANLDQAVRILLESCRAIISTADE
jgi:aminoglycoside phosphotransferase (APT) family kinase protein